MLPIPTCSTETWKFKPDISKGSSDKAPLFLSPLHIGTRLDGSRPKELQFLLDVHFSPTSDVDEFNCMIEDLSIRLLFDIEIRGKSGLIEPN